MDVSSNTEEKATAMAPKPPKLIGVRHVQGLLMFLALLIAYALRVNLSVGIVAMAPSNITNFESDFPVYDWDEQTKSMILSSFFWGYVITQIPAGQLAERFGAKILLVGALTVGSIFTVLTPVAADLGWGMLCGTRVIQGMSQGFIFPSIHTLLAKWAPVEERGRTVTYVYSGSQVGTIIAMSTCGVLAESGGGWPSIFYVYGALGVGWAVLWFFCGADSPATHKFISEEERKYIEVSLGTKHNTKRLKTPWMSFLTSIPMWSLLIVHAGQNWGFWTLLTELPSYMSYVLGFSLKDNGLLSALPYLVMWLLSFVFSWASDFMNKRQIIKVRTSRKIFNSIAHWIPGIALIGLGYITKDNTAGAVALLTVAVGVNSATYVGFQINHIDLSPNFAGTMMGITNCVANIMSIVGPLLVGVIVEDNTSQDQWRVVFFIAAGIYFAGNLMFVLFGKAELQPWNEPVSSARISAHSNTMKDLEKIDDTQSNVHTTSKDDRNIDNEKE